MSAPRNPRNEPELKRLVAALEQLMRSQLDEHRRLMALVDQKRDAVRCADMTRLAALSEQATPVINRLRELESQRFKVAAPISAILQPGSSEPLSAMQIAAGLGEQRGAPLLGLAIELREAVTRTQHASSIVRSAIELLSKHVSGIVQAVHSALTRTQVYGRAGRLAGGAQIVFNVDLKS